MTVSPRSVPGLQPWVAAFETAGHALANLARSGRLERGLLRPPLHLPRQPCRSARSRPGHAGSAGRGHRLQHRRRAGFLRPPHPTALKDPVHDHHRQRHPCLRQRPAHQAGRSPARQEHRSHPPAVDALRSVPSHLFLPRRLAPRTYANEAVSPSTTTAAAPLSAPPPSRRSWP